MVCLDIKPASASPSAASCADANASLLYCLFIALHLDNRSNSQSLRETGWFERQVFVGKHSVRLQFITPEIRPTTFCKTIHKKREFAPAKQHDGPIPTGSATTFPGNALLDDTAAEVDIDLALSSAPHSVTQRGILQFFTVCEAGECLGLECLQSDSLERPPQAPIL